MDTERKALISIHISGLLVESAVQAVKKNVPLRFAAKLANIGLRKLGRLVEEARMEHEAGNLTRSFPVREGSDHITKQEVVEKLSA